MGNAVAVAAVAARGVFRAGAVPVQPSAVRAGAAGDDFGPGDGPGRGWLAGAGVDGADRGPPPGRGKAAGVAVPAAVPGAGAGPVTVVACLRAAGGGLGRDDGGCAGQPGQLGRVRQARRREANARPARQPGQDTAAAYPQLRLVALVACGTRALLDAAVGPARGKGTGERALAGQLLGSLRQGMLLLADRNFYSYQLWNAAAAAGAQLLWRVKTSICLPVMAELPDGSYLAHINDPRAVTARVHKNGTRRRRGSTLPPDTTPLPGITVRVIEFILTVTTDDGGTRTERYRLITTLTDWRACPAADLAAGYAWRWAIEVGHRWHRSRHAAFSWLCSLFVVEFLCGLGPAGTGVEAWRACPAFA